MTIRTTKSPVPFKAVARPVKPVKKEASLAPVPAKAPTKTPKRPKADPVAAPVLDPTKAKGKLVRDSFTIPKAEYLVLETLKLRAGKAGRPAKKSELLRAGIAALNGMSDKAFLAALGAVVSIKTGRPKKEAPVA
jgi:hypothetical protein